MRLLFSVILVAVFAPLTASAVPVTIDFTGTATISNDPTWGGVGSAVTGSYSYDSTAVPTVNGTNPNGSITNTFLSHLANSGLDWSFTLMNGTTVLSLDQTDGLFNFGLFDKTPAGLADTYSFAAPPIAGVGSVSFQLSGIDAAAVAGLNGMVPTDAPDFSLFDPVLSTGIVGTKLKYTFDSFTLRGTVAPPNGTDPGIAFVPEPSAALVFAVGLTVVGRATRRRKRA